MKEIVNGIVSPMTGGRVFLVEDVEKHEFRKEMYDVHVRYYQCEDTREKFTDEKQDELFCNELYNQYRVRHGIPFPDEIKSIRERYKLNYTQVTKIVGFGQNQWRHYENGDVPSESNGRTIAAMRSKEGALYLLEASRNEFAETEYERIKTQIIESSYNDEDSLSRFFFFGRQERGYANGYSEMNPRKLEEMVRYFILNDGNDMCKTKLNKCMFYADMLNYRRTGRSISGVRYRAIEFGPVPEHYDTIYDNVGGVYKTIEVKFNHEYERLHTESMESTSLEEDELGILKTVCDKLKGMSVSDVVELSHKEDVWLRHKGNHELIPYAEAFDIKAFA